jgi:hypothetical protein
MALPPKTSLPALPSNLAPNLRMYLERVREELMRARGDIAATNVTINNITNGGSTSGGGAGGGGTLPCGEPVTPTAPTGLQVTGGFGFFMVEWDYPRYCGHAYTEVYGTQDDASLGTETLLGSSIGTTFSLAEPGTGVRRCFWVKHVNTLGAKGPYNATNGLCATTALDPDILLDTLTGQITETQLFRSLGAQIDKIPLLETGITNETLVRQSQDGALAQEIDQVAAVADENAAGVTEIKTARIGYCSITATGEVTSHQDKYECLDAATGGATRQWNEGLPWASTVTQVRVTTAPFCVLNGAVNKSAAYDTEAECTAAGGIWNLGKSAVIQEESQALQETDGALSAQYSVKIDNAGFVSGFGLSSTPSRATGDPFSEFMIRADRFSISSPDIPGFVITALTRSTTTATLTTSTAHGLVLNDRFSIRGVTGDVNWNAAWKVAAVVSTTRINFVVPDTLKTAVLSASSTLCKVVVPFIVTTTAGVNDEGQPIPPGVYITDAYIKDATITTAKIKNAAITDAKILNLSAGKITAGSIAVDQCIGSAAYDAADYCVIGGLRDASKTTQVTCEAAGGTWYTQDPLWQICGNGAANFRALTIRDSSGNILLSSGTGVAGVGVNLVPASQFYGTNNDNVTPWTLFNSTTTGTYTFRFNADWPPRPGGIDTLVLNKAGATATATGSYSHIWSGFFNVVPNGRYEAFGYLLTLFCDADMRVLWYTAAGALISGADSVLFPAPVPRYTGDPATLECWQRQRVQCFATAPATAATARLFLQVSKADAGQTYAVAALARPYFGRAGTSQTEYSKWYPNYQGPITESSRSTYIRDAAIDTAAIKDLAVTTLKIGGYAVTVPTYKRRQWGASAPETITDTAYDLLAGATGTAHTITISGLPTGAVAGTIFQAGVSLYHNSTDYESVLVRLELTLAGTTTAINIGEVAGGVGTSGSTTFAFLEYFAGYYDLPNGTHTLRLMVRVSPLSTSPDHSITIQDGMGMVTTLSGKR